MLHTSNTLNSSRNAAIQGIASSGLGKNRDQFASTRRWKELLRKFTKEIPQQNHKRQLRNYPDTFTGKEALDCIAENVAKIFNKNCDRQTACRVLKSFLDSNYIANVRDGQDREVYDNSTLFKLNHDPINTFLSDHSPTGKRRQSNVVRASSLRESKSNLDFQQVDEPKAGFQARPNLNTSEWRRLHGRLSISCQDVSAISSRSVRESPPTAAKKEVRGNLSGIVGTISKASASIFSLNRSASTSQTETRKKAKNSNPKFLDDSVLKKEADRNNQTTFDAPHRIHNSVNQSVFRVRTNAMHVPVGHAKPFMSMNKSMDVAVFTEADLFKFWQESLSNRLNSFITAYQFNFNRNFLPRNLSGADIRWNCRQISAKTGIVERLKEQNDDLPRELVATLRILCEYDSAWEQRRSDGKTVQNSAQPIKKLQALVDTVNSHLSRIAPIVPPEMAFCLKSIKNCMEQKDLPVSANSKAEANMLICFRLCLLTLQPSILRKVQILCKYIQRILSNKRIFEILKKDPQKFIHSLSVHFIQPTLPQSSLAISSVDSNSIFTTLIEHSAECLFAMTIPKWLEDDVQKRTHSPNDEKKPISSGEQLSSTTTFCDRIDISTYEQQNKSVDSHLDYLLDTIVSNENLKSAEKFERLKTFRLAHPSIYAKRFPAESDLLLADRQQKNPSPESLLNQLLRKIAF